MYWGTDQIFRGAGLFNFVRRRVSISLALFMFPIFLIVAFLLGAAAVGCATARAMFMSIALTKCYDNGDCYV